MQETNPVLHIYVRVSTSTQEDEGTSISTQIEAGKERAKRLGYKYKVWNEGGQSSSGDDLSNRPQLMEILRGIDDGEIEHLYVWNTDRLSRNLTTWGMIRLQLIKGNVKLHTPTGMQNLSDPQTNLMIGILGEIAQYDNKLRTERFRLGKLSRIRQGFWMGGPPPYGYRLEDHRLVQNPDETKWIEYIFTAYSNGATIDQIRNYLMQNGVVTRRGKVIWSHATIDKILTNTHYCGYYNYTDKKSGDRIRVECPTLLPADLIKRAIETRKKRAYKTAAGHRVKNSNQKYTYLLTGFLVCAHCGSRYGGNKKINQTSYYCCNSKTEKYRTTNPVQCDAKRNLRMEATDTLVWDAVIDTLSNSHTFKETVKLELLDKKSYQLNQVERKRRERQLHRLKTEQTKVTESIISVETASLLGKRNRDELNQIIQNLESHRLDIQSQQELVLLELSNVQKQQKWVDWVSEFGKRVRDLKQQEMDIATKKRFLEGVVDRITVCNSDKTTHQLTIEFRLPYVGDELVTEKHNARTTKYRVKPGTNTKIIFADLVKKTTNYAEGKQ